MPDVSGYGLSINILASISFPVGFTVTQFSDDVDASDIEDLQIGDSAVGLNGDIVSWSTPSIIRQAISVIPDSEDDRNLAILFEANRIGKGKLPIGDVITMTRSLPGKTPEVFTEGKCRSMSKRSIAQGGRIKSKVYVFDFENVVGGI